MLTWWSRSHQGTVISCTPSFFKASSMCLQPRTFWSTPFKPKRFSKYHLLHLSRSKFVQCLLHQSTCNWCHQLTWSNEFFQTMLCCFDGKRQLVLQATILKDLRAPVKFTNSMATCKSEATVYFVISLPFGQKSHRSHVLLPIGSGLSFLGPLDSHDQSIWRKPIKWRFF